MQLHRADPETIRQHQERKARMARIDARAFNEQLAAVSVEMASPESNVVALPLPSRPDECPATARPRQWFFIEYELPAQYPPVSKIQKIVAHHFKLTYHDLLSKSRTKKTIIPRHTAMYLSKELTPRSTVDIGRRFNRDHTVVMFAIRKIAALIESDPDFAADIEVIRKKLVADVQ